MRLIKISLSILILFLFGPHSAWPQTWDLAKDWGDSMNPNGVWSYELRPVEKAASDGQTVTTQSGDITLQEVNVQARIQNLLPKHTNIWFGPASPDFADGPQPAWHEEDGKAHGICKSVGVSNLDFPEGRVGGHSPFLIRWTAPHNAAVQISGGIWMLRDNKRLLGFSIGKFTIESGETTTILEETPIPYPNAGFTSHNPFTFSHAAKTRYAYNDSMLKKVVLQKGDSIWVLINGRSSHGDDFAGLDLIISEIK